MPQYSTYDIVALLVSVLLPPLGVLMKRGLSNSDFWISIILTFLGWLPGLFHAFLVIYLHRDESNKTGEGHPTYGGSRPQTIKIHSTDSSSSNKPNQPQQYHQSQNYQSHYQSPQRQQQYTPPSTPPYSHNSYKDPFNDDNHAGPSNEVPPAYGDHKNDELKGESNSYYSDKKSHNF